MEILADYINGNEHVLLYEDGTKIRETESNEFKPEYPENCDMTISTMCDNGCEFCYMGCGEKGKFADFEKYSFLNNMFSGMELAINLNFPIHPDLVPFLEKMKAQNIFVNGTINENHFMKHKDFIDGLLDKKLLYGIGISYSGKTNHEEFIKTVKQYPNAVIHTIAGLIDKKTIKDLSDHHLKLLILGYKDIGRGTGFKKENDNVINDNIKWLSDILPVIKHRFKLISFDNLAIEQLDLKRWVPEKIWNERYQGDEGTVTFYIDLCNGTFARDSLIKKHFPIENKSLKEMFSIIKEKYK